MIAFFDTLVDPVLRAPMWGTMLVGLTSALVGVLVFVRKRSLLGEALSHTTYPGVALALLWGGAGSCEGGIAMIVLGGAALSALLGLSAMNFLEKKVRLSSDAAFSFALVFFFGVGITLASYLQQRAPTRCRTLSMYLYGQVATMTDLSLILYGGLTLLLVGLLWLFYKELAAASFDPLFAKASGLSSRGVHSLFMLLVVTAVVMGIRSVGVILMSAMFIAPVVTARQFTHRLSCLFWIAGGVGVASCGIGTYLSLCFPRMATGPLIVLVAGSGALYALLFAPQRGVVVRGWRMYTFRLDQRRDNFLKAAWHHKALSLPPVPKGLFLRSLSRRKYIARREGGWRVTEKGFCRGQTIVRLHRLWEAYLVHAMGLGVERVHASAEEMEHILTPDLEERLAQLLNYPQYDPHDQPIPPRIEGEENG